MRLAQLRELVGRKVEVIDPKRALRDHQPHVMHQPRMDKARPRLVEGAGHVGKALPLGRDQAEHVAPEIRHQEPRDVPRGLHQHLAQRQVGADLRLGLFGDPQAFAAADLGEHQPLVGEVAVERGLADPRLPRDVIDRGALEPVAQENAAGAVEHLVELAALADLCLCGGGHGIPLGKP